MPTKYFKSVPDAFFSEFIEPGTNTSELEYHGRGEPIYANGRQVLVRSCHDLMAGYELNGKNGVLLVRRNAEPANGVLWSLGGFMDRGIVMVDSLGDRVKKESGLEVDVDSLIILGNARFLWKTTPHKNLGNLPKGIDDTGLLFYGRCRGDLALDRLHDRPLIVTHEMYTDEFRKGLYDYIRDGMDRVFRHNLL